MRVAFRPDIVHELEEYRSKPKPDQFDRSTFLQKFHLFKGMQQTQPKKLDCKPEELI